MVQIRPDLANFAGYVPGHQPSGGGWIKLNTNESVAASPRARKALESLPAAAYFRYPDPTALPLREALAKKFDLDVSQVVVGNGSDEILSLIIRAVCGPGDTVLSTDPAYSLYPVLAGSAGAAYEAIACDDNFALKVPELSRRNPKVTFITSPNNPAGTAYPATTLAAICAGGQNLVVIDEAYAEYADTNALELLDRFENVAVVRTFSKAYGLAGMRVGYLLGPADLCACLLNLKDSYNVSAASQAAALAALSDAEWAEEMWADVRARRSSLVSELGRIKGLKPHPSQANFVLVECTEPPAAELLAGLEAEKILVRHLPHVRGAENALRITVGNAEELETLTAALRRLCGQ